MSVEIDLVQPQAIEIGATGASEIYQNVRTILLTRKGTVPLDRQFGLDADILDAPTARAQALLSAAIAEAVDTYEPRARVESVEFTGGMDGGLHPVVRISVRGDA
jgi:hypothetical protein